MAGEPWERLGADATRATLLQYLAERTHWLVLLIPPLHQVAHDLADWMDANGYALARVDVL
jgi:cell division inhibitor SulA